MLLLKVLLYTLKVLVGFIVFLLFYRYVRKIDPEAGSTARLGHEAMSWGKMKEDDKFKTVTKIVGVCLVLCPVLLLPILKDALGSVVCQDKLQKVVGCQELFHKCGAGAVGGRGRYARFGWSVPTV